MKQRRTTNLKYGLDLMSRKMCWQNMMSQWSWPLIFFGGYKMSSLLHFILWQLHLLADSFLNYGQKCVLCPWPWKSYQDVLKSKWTFLLNMKKFPKEVPETSGTREQKGQRFTGRVNQGLTPWSSLSPGAGPMGQDDFGLSSNKPIRQSPGVLEPGRVWSKEQRLT